MGEISTVSYLPLVPLSFLFPDMNFRGLWDGGEETGRNDWV